MRTQRNGYADARLKRYDLLAIALPAPHLSTTGKNIPNLLHRAVRNRNRGLLRRQRSSRTSEPSGATTSRVAGSRFVSKSVIG
jgi:hypothetical protein